MEPDKPAPVPTIGEPAEDSDELESEESGAHDQQDPAERERQQQEKRRLKEERKKKMEEDKKNKRKAKKELKATVAETAPGKKGGAKATPAPVAPAKEQAQPKEAEVEDMDAPKASAPVQRVQKVKAYESHTLFLVDGQEVLVENNKIEKWEADRRQREREQEEIAYEKEQKEKLKQETMSELEKLQQNLELKRAMKNKKGKKH